MYEVSVVIQVEGNFYFNFIILLIVYLFLTVDFAVLIVVSFIFIKFVFAFYYTPDRPYSYELEKSPEAFAMVHFKQCISNVLFSKIILLFS